MNVDPFRTRNYVPEFDALVREFADRSEATRATLRSALDIAYGDHPAEKLDLFFPDGDLEEAPVHIFVHGGYWRMFSRKDFSFVADTAAKAGAITAVIGYSLMPAVRMDVIIDQVRRAKCWVRDHIGRYGGDAGHLTISGHSAGAHLCTFLFDEDEKSPGIRAALLLGGIYDLKPLQSSFLKNEIAITDDEVARFSPMGRRHDTDVTVSILVGERESQPFHSQASQFADRLRAQGLNVSNDVVAQADNMSAMRDLGILESQTANALRRFVEGAR
jgi:arylformamidase